MTFRIDKIDKGLVWVTFIKDDGTLIPHETSISNLSVDDTEALNAELLEYGEAYVAGKDRENGVVLLPPGMTK